MFSKVCFKCKSRNVKINRTSLYCRNCGNKIIKNIGLPTEEKRVSWGVHAGKLFKDVPSQYLEWFAKNAYHQMVNRKKWAIEELERRKKLNQ